MRPSAAALGIALALSGLAAGAHAAEEESLPQVNWRFSGIFGTFDRASAQRGFQVYREVCSNCHSIKAAYYRNLEGIGIPPADVKAIAASVQIPTIGDDGQPAERPGVPSDHFRSPFANERAARAANNGALPPDFSVIVKAREGGADYVHALLNGYVDPPPGMKVGEGLYYNKWFVGNQIAMPPPLTDGRVTYADGTKATLDQESRDVANFLTYISNPEMETRKRTGVKVVIFLALLTGITYAVKRQVWADVH